MLNKVLYDRLVEVFGDVGVTNEGEPAELLYTYPPTLSGSIKVQWAMQEGSTGEWYTVRCPFCQDRGKHLNISYMSYSAPVVPGYQTEQKGLIANCFHGCLNNNPNRLIQLNNLIKVEGTTYLKIDKSTPATKHEELSEDPSLEGIRTWCNDYHPILQNETLPNRVFQYISSRNWTIEQLQYVRAGWGTVTSYSSGNWLNNGDYMLIFPFIQRGQLKGFQARALASKEECDQRNLLRWYTHPAMKKTAVLYNFDNAVKFPFVCVAEGVTDVLGIGPYGVGTMGTTAGRYQMQLLAANWSEGCAIWLPDRKLIHNADGSVTNPVDLARAKVREANAKGYFRDGAFVVEVPGDDPGSLSQEQIWEAICSQLNPLPRCIISMVNR